MRKHSKQRELILNYLRSANSHPTAEQIYADLKTENPALSLSTVYRNLNLLTEYGVIRKLSIGENGDRYEAVTKEHNHYFCSRCNRVTDVYTALLNHSALAEAIGDGCTVDQHHLYLYGICGDCRKKQ
ncbi:MAG: transcriptional repressor [Ruminococcaceae bacterium]|nr:transcriptional repressor [Oscillospiraceae bacterium]